jgi:hypothetical protein
LSLATVAAPAALFAQAQVPPGSAGERATDRPVMETYFVAAMGGLEDMTTHAFGTVQAIPDAHFGIGVGAEIAMGYFFCPFLSGGAHLRYQFHPFTGPQMPAAGAHGDTLVAGTYLRWYIGSTFREHRVDPWIQVGVDPASMFWESFGLPNTTIVLQTTSISVPLRAGVSFALNDSVRVDLGGEYAWWFPLEQCATFTSAQMGVCRTSGLVQNQGWVVSAGMRFVMPGPHPPGR